MGYVRSNLISGTGAKSPQPGKVDRTDIFGNTFENWCADYVPRDVDGNVASVTTFACVDYDPLKAMAWEHWNYDHSAQRPLFKFEQDVTLFDEFIPTADNPLLADEDDLTIEISDGQFTYSLYSESNIPIRFEENTDIVFKGANDIIATEDLLNTIQTNDGRDLSVE